MNKNDSRYLGKTIYQYTYDTSYSKLKGKNRFSIKKITWNCNRDPNIGKVDYDGLKGYMNDVDGGRMNYFVNEIKKAMLSMINTYQNKLETFESDCLDYSKELDLSLYKLEDE